MSKIKQYQAAKARCEELRTKRDEAGRAANRAATRYARLSGLVQAAYLECQALEPEAVEELKQ